MMERELRMHFENLRQWTEEHPQSGPIVRNAEELQQLVAEEEHERPEASTLTLNEEPPGRYRDKTLPPRP